MNKSLEEGTKFNESVVRQEMFQKAEEPFTFDRSTFPTEPTGKIKTIFKKFCKLDKDNAPDVKRIVNSFI